MQGNAVTCSTMPCRAVPLSLSSHPFIIAVNSKGESEEITSEEESEEESGGEEEEEEEYLGGRDVAGHLLRSRRQSSWHNPLVFVETPEEFFQAHTIWASYKAGGRYARGGTLAET